MTPTSFEPAPYGPRAVPLTDAELAIGVALGDDPTAPPLVPKNPPQEPLVALETVLASALARPPCLFSFSGGRDSSALLAVATRVARRDGYPLPVPATLFFPGVETADEEAWQRPVLENLGLEEWIRIGIDGDEFDAIGPVATRALRRFGLLCPFNTHFHAPIIERAAGGSVVTGFGGDELALCSTTIRAARVLARQIRPRAKDALVVGLALAPRPVKVAVHQHRAKRQFEGLPWLTATGRRGVARAIGSDDGRTPLGWARTLRTSFTRGRYFRVSQHSLDLLGSVADVRVLSPFLDPFVLDALASAGGLGGFGNRTRMVSRLFGELLPERTVSRPTKATFDGALWTATTRRFAARWSGGGVNREWIDVAALRRHWAQERPDSRSATLLQAAWLHDAADAARRPS